MRKYALNQKTLKHEGDQQIALLKISLITFA